MEVGREVSNKKQLKKQRRKRNRLTELFFDFSKNTSLHGFKYVTRGGLVEKLFWLCTFCLSVTMCAYLIHNIYIKWKTSPVIVHFSEEMVSVGQIPFPSVTICPQLKVKRTTYNYTQEIEQYLKYYRYLLRNGSAGPEIIEKVKKLDDVNQICDTEDRLMGRKQTDKFIEHIMDVTPKQEDVLAECFWRGEEENCSEMFSSVLTDEGICFNFNSLSANDIFNNENIQKDYKYTYASKRTKGWSLLDGYDYKVKNSYPRRGRENSARPDLEVNLKTFVNDQDNLCNGVNEGYKIYVQHPKDFPQSSIYYYAALPDEVSSLAIKFNMITTSESLKSYFPKQRQCYFPWERQLRYFKIYSYNNCKMECKANYTFEACGCVKFFMPHENSNSICPDSKKKCIKKAINNLSDKEKNGKDGRCNCLPACDSIHYDAEVLKTKYVIKKYVKNRLTFSDVLYNLSAAEAEDLSSYLIGFKFSKIEMYYKEPRFVTIRRSELFGSTDFMASIGGLLGLFLGFSFMSLAEIFYFITIRICCTLTRDCKNKYCEENAENKNSESSESEVGNKKY